MEDSIHSIGRVFYTQAALSAPKVLAGVLIFAAFWAAGRMLKGVFIRVCHRARLDWTLVNLLSRTLQILAVILGAVTALGTAGVNVSAMIAGLGLTGFAIGFAMKDALSNLLAGVSILLYRPFRIGDSISVTGFEGKVVDIDLRYTLLKTEDKRILIPNSSLFTNAVSVLEAEEAVRV